MLSYNIPSVITHANRFYTPKTTKTMYHHIAIDHIIMFAQPLRSFPRAACQNTAHRCGDIHFFTPRWPFCSHVACIFSRRCMAHGDLPGLPQSPRVFYRKPTLFLRPSPNRGNPEGTLSYKTAVSNLDFLSFYTWSLYSPLCNRQMPTIKMTVYYSI